MIGPVRTIQTDSQQVLKRGSRSALQPFPRDRPAPSAFQTQSLSETKLRPDRRGDKIESRIGRILFCRCKTAVDNSPMPILFFPALVRQLRRTTSPAASWHSRLEANLPKCEV